MSHTDFSYKQVIAVRMDLKMGRGKMAAQVGHAAVSSAEKARKRHPKSWKAWLDEGQCKVVVKVAGLAELEQLETNARQSGLPTSLISDRGLTQLPPGTVTCLAIGPALSSQIDKITGNLLLL